MARRRLRLRYSSEEDEEERKEQEGEGQEPTTAASATVFVNSPNPNPSTNTNSNSAAAPENLPFEISDDDFIDVPENFSPPSPVAPNADQPFQESAGIRPDPDGNSGEGPGCPVEEFLRGLGLRLRREWLDSCIAGLQSSVFGFATFDVARKAKLCFEQFLFSDMNYSGGGVLPENVHAMHLIELAGPFVLQVDEIVNISCPLRDRYQSAPSGVKRCLKLSMTDGAQRVFGMEYRPIKDLEVLSPAGLKVAIRNVNIQRGLLMLVPEVLEVLGGLVEELDAARQRLVHEVNKPPRGKRTRTGIVPSLATRATLAAWPSNNVNNQGNANDQGHANSSTTRDSTHLQTSNQGAISAVPGSDTGERVIEGYAAPSSTPSAEANLFSNAFLNVEDIHMVDDVEHPPIFAGDPEVPFTYFTSLLAKWAAKKDEVSSVQGKIKCFLTGVKGFQFKQRTTFELQVYVDDGSLISEVLIDHSVVQNGVGYSPVEVTAALSSSDKKIVGDMKETMKQFQTFLANFEGTMLVEINETSPLPVALEMNQGCSASDAWLLLRRLKTFTSAQIPQHLPSDPINISP